MRYQVADKFFEGWYCPISTLGPECKHLDIKNSNWLLILQVQYSTVTAISPVMLPDDPLLLSKGFPGDHVWSVRSRHFVLTIIILDHPCNVGISTVV